LVSQDSLATFNLRVQYSKYKFEALYFKEKHDYHHDRHHRPANCVSVSTLHQQPYQFHRMMTVALFSLLGVAFSVYRHQHMITIIILSDRPPYSTPDSQTSKSTNILGRRLDCFPCCWWLCQPASRNAKKVLLLVSSVQTRHITLSLYF
jgi:hypothetical protein